MGSSCTTNCCNDSSLHRHSHQRKSSLASTHLQSLANMAHSDPKLENAHVNHGFLVRRRARKEKSRSEQVSDWFIRSQTTICVHAFALLLAVHCFVPAARSVTRKFFTPAYFNPQSGRYAIGTDDLYVLASFTMLFTGLRHFVMENVLGPLARKGGLTRQKQIDRFSEQGWLFVYYCVLWGVGMYIYWQAPYFLSLRELWSDWPNREMDVILKIYLLAEWAFWLQQAIVIHIEERRKDHVQMLAHHVITIALISSCYAYHFTRVGHVVLVLMDVVDLFLPLAKCLKYTGFSNACDYVFGVFMLVWFTARHVLFMVICWSTYVHLPTPGCFRGANASLTGPFPTPSQGYSHLIEPFLRPDGIVCFNAAIKTYFLSALLLLQCITLIWFVMIIRVAVRVLNGHGADDERSDCEDEEEEEEPLYEEEEYDSLLHEKQHAQPPQQARLEGIQPDGDGPFRGYGREKTLASPESRSRGTLRSSSVSSASSTSCSLPDRAQLQGRSCPGEKPMRDA